MMDGRIVHRSGFIRLDDFDLVVIICLHSEIEAHKKAQEVYSLHDGKLPTLKELSEEYEKLKAQKEADTADLAALKSKLTTLNHVKYNFDTLERDHLPEDQQQRHSERNVR